MRRVLLIICMAALCCGGWLLWKRDPYFFSALSSADFHTFKIRFPAEKIMESHKKELLKNGGSYLEPRLSYFPYLMMEVKYTKMGGETREGMLLWGLSDGEMVLNVESWEKTHGYEDCLMAHASASDFKVLRAIALAGGSCEREKIGEEEGISSCLRKKLIVESGTKLRLHLQNPKLEIEPQTKLGEWVVTLPEGKVVKTKKRYSASQVVKMTEQAFGSDFAIRRTREVFLPVIEIAIQNTDGSVLTTYWNALTGKQLDEHLREISASL